MKRLDKEKDAVLIGRLVNWKFSSALSHLRDDHPKEITTVVKALAASFCNSGWFDGTMAAIVGRSIYSMVPEDEDD